MIQNNKAGPPPQAPTQAGNVLLILLDSRIDARTMILVHFSAAQTTPTNPVN